MTQSLSRGSEADARSAVIITVVEEGQPATGIVATHSMTRSTSAFQVPEDWLRADLASSSVTQRRARTGADIDACACALPTTGAFRCASWPCAVRDDRRPCQQLSTDRRHPGVAESVLARGESAALRGSGPRPSATEQAFGHSSSAAPDGGVILAQFGIERRRAIPRT
jgi:hypothetical protein